MRSLLATNRIMITGWWLFDDVWCVIHRDSSERYCNLFLNATFDWNTVVAPNSTDLHLKYASNNDCRDVQGSDERHIFEYFLRIIWVYQDLLKILDL